MPKVERSLKKQEKEEINSLSPVFLFLGLTSFKVLSYARPVKFTIVTVKRISLGSALLKKLFPSKPCQADQARAKQKHGSWFWDRILISICDKC